MEPEVSLPHLQVSATCPILSPLDQVHTSKTNFFKIYLNIILNNEEVTLTNVLKVEARIQSPETFQKEI